MCTSSAYSVFKPIQVVIFMWMRRSFIAIIVVIIGLSAFVPQASAHPSDDDDFEVEFISGSYHDLDADGYVDDIKTVFSIEADDYVHVTYVYTRLFLPSGMMFDLHIFIIGNFQEIVITIGWFNCLRESGWYYSDVYTETAGSDMASDWILFDPPTEGIPGGPSIDIIDVEVKT